VNIMVSFISNMCTPAKLYFALSLLMPLVFSFIQIHPIVVVFHIITVICWITLLAYLCERGFTNLSWILVILPFVCIFMFLILYIYLYNNAKVVTNDTTLEIPITSQGNIVTI